MPARETQRLARRRAVAEAAHGWQRVASCGRHANCVFRRARSMNALLRDDPPITDSPSFHVSANAAVDLDAALALPRPWAQGFQRWQPRRTTRRTRHRQNEWAWGPNQEYVYLVSHYGRR